MSYFIINKYITWSHSRLREDPLSREAPAGTKIRKGISKKTINEPKPFLLATILAIGLLLRQDAQVGQIGKTL